MNYKVYYIVLAILLIYGIIVIRWYTKLDKVNKTAIYYFIKNVHLHSCDKLTLRKYILEVVHVLAFPFHTQLYFEKYSEGGFYSSYFYEMNKPLAIKMNDKIFWYSFFKKNNVNHPKLIQYKKDNKIHRLEKIENEKYYICKPINGCLGANIFKIQGKDIDSYFKKDNNILVQDKLFDCLLGKARHFRLITLYNGSKFSLLSLKASDNTKLTSNYAMGGSVHLCKNLHCEDLDDESHSKLNIMIDRLTELHKLYFSKVLHIGWDLMIDCEDKSNFEIYCLEGNLASGIWDAETMDTNVIADYKNLADDFYKKSKLLNYHSTNN